MPRTTPTSRRRPTRGRSTPRAPQTTLGSGLPPANTNSTSATFNFSADEQGSTFECSLDGAAFSSCASPKPYTGLSVGLHEFRVQAKDPAGNVDGTPASYSWRVEAPPPDCGTATVSASVLADSWVDQGSPAQNKGTDSVLKLMSKGPSKNVRSMIRFASPTPPAGCAVKTATLRLYAASFREGRTLQALRLAGAWDENQVTWDNQPQTAGSPAAAPSRSTAGYVEWDVRWQLQGMYDTGAHHGFLIRDAAEDGDAEQQLNSREKGSDVPQLLVTWGPRDTTPPETAIDSGPQGTTLDRNPTFTFSANQEGSTFQCSLDGATFASCSSPKQYTGLTLGNHELRVRATDPAGNVDSTPASRSWTVAADSTAPETTLGSGAPDATTTSRTARFNFTGTDNVDPAAQLAFECSLNGGAFQACTSPKDYTDLANQTHSFRVRAKDSSGNVDGSPASYTWTVQAAQGPSCTTSTQTAAADRDAWVLQSAPSSNFGNDSVLKVDTKSGGNARALVRFALPAIPTGCRVTGATLRLYSASYKEGRTIQAYRLGATFVEGGVNWGNQPATSGTAANAPSRNSSGHVEWSVTAQVQAMYGLNTGFLIRDASENGGGMEQAFNSREKGADNPPQLVITFGP